MRIKDSEGNFLEADDIDIVEANEPWSEYLLADGTKLKIKLVVGSVARMKEGTTPTGDPIYVARSQNVIMAEVPDNLTQS